MHPAGRRPDHETHRASLPSGKHRIETRGEAPRRPMEELRRWIRSEFSRNLGARQEGLFEAQAPEMGIFGYGRDWSVSRVADSVCLAPAAERGFGAYGEHGDGPHEGPAR